MATVINDNLLVCVDCFDVINGNVDALDLNDVERIAAKLGMLGGTVYAGDYDKGMDFCLDACHGCGSKLHGSRNHCVVLA